VLCYEAGRDGFWIARYLLAQGIEVRIMHPASIPVERRGRRAKLVPIRIRGADPRIIRLIQKWLKAGVLEDEVVMVSDRGTGQGSVASPLLANIYLHYVFDVWANRWRQREATRALSS
jgi:hypothetical protein